MAGDKGAVVIREGAGDDFSSGRRIAVDQDNDGVLGALLAVGGAVDLVGKGTTALLGSKRAVITAVTYEPLLL